MSKAVTIVNKNTATSFSIRNWNTGLVSATDPAATATVAGDYPIVVDGGLVKFRFWELEQFAVLSAYNGSADVTGTGNDDGNKIVIGGVDSAAELAYYTGMDGVAGLVVTSADET